jgi:hypothetical protein
MRYVEFTNHVMIAAHQTEFSLKQLESLEKEYGAEMTLEGQYMYLLIPKPVQINWKKIGVRKNIFTNETKYFDYETGEDI